MTAGCPPGGGTAQKPPLLDTVPRQLVSKNQVLAEEPRPQRSAPVAAASNLVRLSNLQSL